MLPLVSLLQLGGSPFGLPTRGFRQWDGAIGFDRFISIPRSARDGHCGGRVGVMPASPLWINALDAVK